MKKYLTISILLINVLTAFSQRTITGKIVDVERNAIPGATILSKSNIELGTISDIDGNFCLTNIKSSDTIFYISFVGLQTEELILSSNTYYEITLKQPYTIYESYVTYYGFSREIKRAGYSKTKFKEEEIEAVKPINFLESFQGKIPGANITKSGVDDIRIIMRGYSSLQGINQPLIIVNGVPIN